MKKDHKKCCICRKTTRRWSGQRYDALEYERYMEIHGDAGNAPMMQGLSRDAGNQAIMDDFPVMQKMLP